MPHYSKRRCEPIVLRTGAGSAYGGSANLPETGRRSGDLGLDASALQLRVEPAQQPVEFLEVGARKLGPGRTDMARGDEAAPAENFLAQGEAEARLLLVPQQRQVEIVQVFASLG